MALVTKVISEPVYYHREYENDISKKSEENSWSHNCQRVALIALPFFSLYKTLSLPISLGMGALRTWSNANLLLTSIQQGNRKDIPYHLLQTMIAVISLAGTIFAHPFGMLITTGQDLVIETIHLVHHLQKGEYKEALESCANIINNSLYFALFLHGGLEIGIASLAMQIMLGIYHSHKEFGDGNYLEGAAHLLMGVVRGYQLAGQVELLQTKWKIEAFRREMLARQAKINQMANEARPAIVASSNLILGNTTISPELLDILKKYHSFSAAIEANDYRAIRIMVENNVVADINVRGGVIHNCITGYRDSGRTALEKAIEVGDIVLVSLVLHRGADPLSIRYYEQRQQGASYICTQTTAWYEAVQANRIDILQK
ncbi:MAG: hypothetical protein ABUT20_55335, partial [Bacteroidota bacterium]